jgi:aspartyl-tRNA(Asn)/glutamyl-tRNA(Gln) amidotransferase subunit A
MTKNIEDNAMVLNEIAGIDEKDATTSAEEVPDYTKSLEDSLKGKTIGLPKEYFGKGLDDEVRKAVEEAVERFKSIGCKVKEISLPYTDYAVAAYYIVGISEASSNLARMDGIRFGYKAEGDNWKDIMRKTRGEGFGPEEKRRIMIGTYALSAGYADQYYKKAQKVRAMIKQDFIRALGEVDIIIIPTMPMLPFKFGEISSDPLQMWLADAFTVSLNPTGLPGLAVPAGKSKLGLPVGMQLIGPHFSEPLLYNFGYQYEKLWNMNQS